MVEASETSGVSDPTEPSEASEPLEASEPSDQDGAQAGVAGVQEMFTRFASGYPELRLYGAICRGASADDGVAALLTAARPGQARPVLFLAALHDLVLRRPDLPAGRWYPSVTRAPVPEGDPWPDVRRTCLDHADELRATIATRSTQTNEVNRVVYVAPLLAQAASDVPDSPVALVEMGASAGLLLGLDRYRIEVTGPGGAGPVVLDDPIDGRGGRPAAPVESVVLGDPESVAVCAGVQRNGSSLRGLRLPTVVERVGLEHTPVDLDDVDEIRWLEACLWPDVPVRLERFRAAVALLRADPPSVVAGDMVDDMEAVARSARAVAEALAADGTDTGRRGRAGSASGEARSTGPGDAGRAGPSGAPVHLVVFSSWALTYVARARRPLVAEALARLAADGRPVTWLTAEPPGCVPHIPGDEEVDADGDTDTSTVLGVRRWRAGAELPPARWGTCHPHGTSLSWTPPDP